ncbi:MBL fold metallo-hydrolase [Candidatus Falkowbacteria bacterium]|nr:MBL fold metallo-hydrolase [Candidatus Falkowbacteria bacterium]
MQIQWLGQSYFRIQTKNNGDEVIIATDPYGADIGLKPPKIQADIVTISHQHHDHNNLDAIKGEPFVIDGPGEYETKGVFIYGIPAWHDNKEGKERGSTIMYRLIAENMNILHLGDLGDLLTNEQIEKINEVDILLIPVGGIYTIDGKKANEIISQLEPRLVIPMHYKIPGFKTSTELHSVDQFIKESGLLVEKMDKLKIAKKDLPQEETKIILLNI